jgi:hypothetical protein
MDRGTWGRGKAVRMASCGVWVSLRPPPPPHFPSSPPLAPSLSLSLHPPVARMFCVPMGDASRACSWFAR